VAIQAIGDLNRRFIDGAGARYRIDFSNLPRSFADGIPDALAQLPGFVDLRMLGASDRYVSLSYRTQLDPTALLSGLRRILDRQGIAYAYQVTGQKISIRRSTAPFD
jgi:hypothetical protein